MPITAPQQQSLMKFITKNQQLLVNLWNRWYNEGEYEDINEYGQRIAREFPAGWALVGTTKRPFGVKVVMEDNVNRQVSTVHIKVTDTRISFVKI